MADSSVLYSHISEHGAESIDTLDQHGMRYFKALNRGGQTFHRQIKELLALLAARRLVGRQFSKPGDTFGLLLMSPGKSGNFCIQRRKEIQ